MAARAAAPVVPMITEKAVKALKGGIDQAEELGAPGVGLLTGPDPGPKGRDKAVDLLVAEQANVIGSLYYHGIMQVMDEYPGDSQLVEQYNIFGDCSLMVRTARPTAVGAP